MKTNLSTEELIRLLEALNSSSNLSEKENNLKEKVVGTLDSRFHEQAEDEEIPDGNGSGSGSPPPLQGGIDTPF